MSEPQASTGPRTQADLPMSDTGTSAHEGHPRAPTGSAERDVVTDEMIRDHILAAIRDNRVMLFMKGTPAQPACGFSARTVACLNEQGMRYAAMDILPDPRIRQILSGISQWPTIPQLFVDGELVGGCDIVTEMHESGELTEVLKAST